MKSLLIQNKSADDPTGSCRGGGGLRRIQLRVVEIKDTWGGQITSWSLINPYSLAADIIPV